jgi:hypothetical protein
MHRMYSGTPDRVFDIMHLPRPRLELRNPRLHLLELLLDHRHDARIRLGVRVDQVVAMARVGHDEDGVRLGRGQGAAGSEVGRHRLLAPGVVLSRRVSYIHTKTKSEKEGVPLGPDHALRGARPAVRPGIDRVRAFAVGAGVGEAVVGLEVGAAHAEVVVVGHETRDDGRRAGGRATTYTVSLVSSMRREK